MTRVPSIPFRVRVIYKPGPSGAALPDQWHSFRTMAGLIEYRAKALTRQNVHRIESYAILDETVPGIPQVEPDMKTQSTQGSGDRKLVTHSNRR